MKCFLWIWLAVVSLVCFSVQAQEGTTNLFDGKTLKGWKRLTGTADFRVSGDAIVGTTVANSPNSFLVSEKKFSNFILDLDILVKDTSMNSGVQIRSHYNPAGNAGKGQVFGLQVEVDPSARKWSGGIYDEGRRGWLYPVSLNSHAADAFQLGIYNHYRIEGIGQQTRTWINGKSVAFLVDNADQEGFVAIQVHAVGNGGQAGKKVFFKNIRIHTLALKPAELPEGIFVVNTMPNQLTSYERAGGWRLLFDGKTAAGWVGAYKNEFPARGWVVEHGILRVLPSAGKEAANGGDIVTTAQYRAFDLSFEFKLTPGANSGVKYFVTLQENNSGSAIGLEYQLLDDQLHPDAKLGTNGDRTLASLYDLIPSQKQERFVHPIGDWNSGRIIVFPNNHVEHYLNGIKVLSYERGGQAFRDLVALSKYKIWPNFGEAAQGHILLQDHGTEVSFRSIKIRELEAKH